MRPIIWNGSDAYVGPINNDSLQGFEYNCLNNGLVVNRTSFDNPEGPVGTVSYLCTDCARHEDVLYLQCPKECRKYYYDIAVVFIVLAVVLLLGFSLVVCRR